MRRVLVVAVGGHFVRPPRLQSQPLLRPSKSDGVTVAALTLLMVGKRRAVLHQGVEHHEFVVSPMDLLQATQIGPRDLTECLLTNSVQPKVAGSCLLAGFHAISVVEPIRTEQAHSRNRD